MLIEDAYRTGAALYGDDFEGDALRTWYEQEESGYFALLTEADRAYPYHALNRFHAMDSLKGPFERCVVLGCAKGHDILPLVPKIKSLVGIEPAEKWWTDSISGVPATFLKPTLDGSIPLPDRSADLAVSIAVLHHIATVSKSLSEIARILIPGGKFVLREPISSMGDWTKPRPGLTKNERGLPAKWLHERLEKDFKIVRKRYCVMPTTYRLGLGVQAFNFMPAVVLDYLMSSAMSWNSRYWRPRRFDKFAPTAICYVLERR